MAKKKIREYDAKRILTRHLLKKGFKVGGAKSASDDPTSKPTYEIAQVSAKAIDEHANGNRELFYDKLSHIHPWLLHKPLVVKPDMLFGKRGKNNLVLLKANYEVAQSFINEKLNQPLEISGVNGILSSFVIEPFTAHDDEFYMCMQTLRDGERISFGLCGGIEIEENWDKIESIVVPNEVLLNDNETEKNKMIKTEYIEKLINTNESRNNITLAKDIKQNLIEFVSLCYQSYIELDMTLLEMNPFTIVASSEGLNTVVLDIRMELDYYALFKNIKLWSIANPFKSQQDELIEIPEAWGLNKTEEEKYIENMDEKSGSSLKLTILNPEGRIWTMVAGGGASVIYTDQIVQLGYGNELGNYAEYSGNPKQQETYMFARTLLSLLTKPYAKNEGKRKALVCGGGVANFSDVAATFAGLQQAISDFHGKLQVNKVKIFVRRGGPNYKAGLQIMRDLGKNLDIPIDVYGPDMDMTNICSLAIRWIEQGI